MFCNLDAIAYLGVLAIDSWWIQLNVKCETKTKDNVFVNVVASVQYRTVADKASDAFYKLTNKREQIQSYVFDVIRASVPKLEPDTSLSRRMIAKAVEDELEKAMSTYAYDIVQTLIVDIEPDVNVKRAMNEINAAARMRTRLHTRKPKQKRYCRSRKLSPMRTRGKDDSIAEWTTDRADTEVWVDAVQASELRVGRRSPTSSH